MAYNHGKENASFAKKWAKEEKILKEAGMQEEAITELFEFDLMTFNSNRRFRIHNCSFAEFEENDIDVYEKNPMMKKFKEALTVEMEISPSANNPFAWLDELDSEWLTLAVKGLEEEEKYLVTGLIVNQYTLVELAEQMGQTPSWITWKKGEIRKKLEKAKANHTS